MRTASHGGGVRDPLIVRWPARIQGGGLREQFCHAIDIAPTILEAAGIATPEVVAGVAQMPVHGRSLTATFANAAAPVRPVLRALPSQGTKIPVGQRRRARLSGIADRTPKGRAS